MKEDVQRNQTFLKELRVKNGDKFHACFELGYPWQIFPDDMEGYNQLINHREVLPTEVVFDFDTPEPEKRDFYYKLIVSKLKTKGVSFSSYKTGGKGIHIHMFFPELANYSVDDRKVVKESIIDYFFTHPSGKKFSHLAKVDYQLCTRHLVRAEYGMHEKTKNYKLPIENYVLPLPNKIPAKAVTLFELKKNRPQVEKKKLPYYMRDGRVAIKFKAIEYILSEDFAGHTDGRKRALNILCSYFYCEEGAKGVERVLEWNDYKLNRYFSEEKIKEAYKGISKMVDGGKRFGLASIKNLMKELGVKESLYI